MTETEEPNPDGVAKVVELTKDIRIAMLTTLEDDGRLVARPMAQQEVEFDGDLWFFVEADSRTAANLNREPRAGVSLSSTGTWVSLAGRGEIVRDVEKAKELWNAGVEAWLPQGPEDPNVVLIRFGADSAEYWDSPGGRVATIASFVKAKVSGERIDAGSNETVDLS